MPTPADNSLEGRIADLEAQVRALRATNLTDLASVVDASGNTVPLSGLAFGQVASVWPGVGVVALNAAAGAAALDPKTAAPAQWAQPSPGLSVDVLVRAGRLRVDWAALLAVSGAAGVAATIVMSYTLDYLGPQGSKGSVNTRVANPDYYRGIQIRDNPALANTGQQGSWYMHTGLTPGWYRVWAAWILGTPGATSSTGASSGSADNPRIGATPF